MIYFNQIKKDFHNLYQNSMLGAYILLQNLIEDYIVNKGFSFTEHDITHYFDTLVPKDDYDKKDERTLIEHLLKNTSKMTSRQITISKA